MIQMVSGKHSILVHFLIRLIVFNLLKLFEDILNGTKTKDLFGIKLI